MAKAQALSVIAREEVASGMTIRIHQKIKEEAVVGKKGKGEEAKERMQIFEGLVIARRGAGQSASITVRKIAEGVGVEMIFPLYMPAIEKIEKVKESKVRRSKLYFMRDNPKKLKDLV
ncbi:MAG: LSU ribosomal protein L19P [Parcubacteria group bacterium Gr01-1014_18]|nr:MAG: LSU ribosomal protein L19P [Parcubacteria group bacterium Greene0416_36]TSC80106.1 MAG: LSU ribosomal protein L19P [Parcubacteria group bacterium Gr01-1014_18]TSC98604.1 MAG: LSU ribosomal protein L19P [Parcubacteria group bacterium Greene1014_20]TSD06431.1 MAG: LSU ribosomal protein L19P [Parcubacteria group bacterium Greene0714_2]